MVSAGEPVVSPEQGVGGAPAPVRARPPRGPSRAQRRLADIRHIRTARALTQLAFAALIISAAVRHQLEKGTASVDALCPFGAIETLFTWVTAGHFVNHIHQSNMVLGLSVLVATVLVGNAFCGWVCPFGAFQDALTWVKRKLHVHTVHIPRVWDARLRWGRFVVLAVIVWMSATTARLWFSDYDPYLTVFSLRWLFEFNARTMLLQLTILAVVVAGSLLVERFWCRYLCPLGAVFAVAGHLSILRIRRSPAACTDCARCDAPCPMGIEPSRAQPFVSTDCIGCMECVVACPVAGSLKVDGPVFLGTPLRPDYAGPSRPHRPDDAGPTRPHHPDDAGPSRPHRTPAGGAAHP